MTYRSVWWHDPVQYAAGLQPCRTYPVTMEQYRRPADQRYYDLPTENYRCKLYYERPKIATPEYRGKFRDLPHTVTAYNPMGLEGKPRGFHGRLYYEQENPRFKYEGNTRNDLYWLEMPPHRKVFPEHNLNSVASVRRDAPTAQRTTTARMSVPSVHRDAPSAGQSLPRMHRSDRLTQDGVGYL